MAERVTKVAHIQEGYQPRACTDQRGYQPQAGVKPQSSHTPPTGGPRATPVRTPTKTPS